MQVSDEHIRRVFPCVMSLCGAVHRVCGSKDGPSNLARVYKKRFGQDLYDHLPSFEPYRVYCSMPAGQTMPLDLSLARVLTPQGSHSINEEQHSKVRGGSRVDSARCGPAGAVTGIAKGRLVSASGAGAAAAGSALAEAAPIARSISEPGALDSSTSGAVTAIQTATTQPQFADDDPDSPYTVLVPTTYCELLVVLDSIMMQGFKALCTQHGMWLVPRFPRTKAEAAALQAQIDQLLQDGRRYWALPWQCQLAMYCLWSEAIGTGHADTVQAVWSVISNMTQQGPDMKLHELCTWLLPRAAKLWGLGHPNTRQLVGHAADLGHAAVLTELDEPAAWGPAIKAVYNVAKHLPGGLGWGAAAVAPVPDEETFNMHVALQVTTAMIVLYGKQQQVRQARDDLQRCVAYYESIGPHWLASVCKVRALRQLAACAARLDGDAAAEPMLAIAKRTAQRELGATHLYTLLTMCEYAQHLNSIEAFEKAKSMLQKCCGLQKTHSRLVTTLSIRHWWVLHCAMWRSHSIVCNRACALDNMTTLPFAYMHV